MAWPDIVAAFVAIVGALKGFKRGLVSELAGAVALAFGIVAAFHYQGVWDGWMRERLHLAPGSAHVAAMIFYAVAAYAIVLALAGALSAVAKLPLIGIANALLGAVVGLAKACIFMWVAVYVALFFPLTPSVRDDLHRSRFVALLREPSARLDDALRTTLPAPMRPFADSVFGPRNETSH